MHLAAHLVGAFDGLDAFRSVDKLEGAGVGEGQGGPDAERHPREGGRDRADQERDRGEGG